MVYDAFTDRKTLRRTLTTVLASTVVGPLTRNGLELLALLSLVSSVLLGCASPNTYATARTVPQGEFQHTVAVEGIGFPSVRVETEFLSPLRYGDRARVQIEVLEVGRKSLTLGYELTRMPDAVLSARATITTVAIDNALFASVAIPDAWRERFERFRAAA